MFGNVTLVNECDILCRRHTVSFYPSVHPACRLRYHIIYRVEEHTAECAFRQLSDRTTVPYTDSDIRKPRPWLVLRYCMMTWANKDTVTLAS